MKNSLSEIVPLIALKELVDALIPPDVKQLNTLQLLIRIENFNLNARELSAFLAFIDRVYGRMKDWNLSKYSRRPSQQLKIHVHSGSIEVVILEIYAVVKEHLVPLMVLFTVLKIIKPMSEAVKNSSESYKLIAEAKKLLSEEIKNKAEARKLLSEANKFDEDSKLITVNRQKIEVERNVDLINALDKQRMSQIFKLLKEIYAKEKKSLPKVKKFADEKIKEIKLGKGRGVDL